MTMTVKSLVERLKAYPQDAIIIIDGAKGKSEQALTQLYWSEGNQYKEKGVHFE